MQIIQASYVRPFFFFLGFGFVGFWGGGVVLQIPGFLGSVIFRSHAWPFIFFNWLKHYELHISQTHETSTRLPPLFTQQRNRDALTP